VAGFNSIATCSGEYAPKTALAQPLFTITPCVLCPQVFLGVGIGTVLASFGNALAPATASAAVKNSLRFTFYLSAPEGVVVCLKPAKSKWRPLAVLRMYAVGRPAFAVVEMQKARASAGLRTRVVSLRNSELAGPSRISTISSCSHHRSRCADRRSAGIGGKRSSTRCAGVISLYLAIGNSELTGWRRIQLL